MKHLLSFTTCVILFLASPASAQNKGAAGVRPNYVPLIKQRVMNLIRAADQRQGPSRKNSSAVDPVRAEANYDLTKPAGSQFTDSTYLVYNGSRTAAFDYDAFSYDYDNNADVAPVQANSFVNFDTMRVYLTKGSSSNTRTIRTYNTNGKIIQVTSPDYIGLYQYNAQGKVSRLTRVEDIPRFSVFDSSQRDHYIYDANGFMVRDSIESFNVNTRTWQPNTTIVYINNAAGYPLSGAVTLYIPLTPPQIYVVAQFDIAYNSANRPLAVTVQQDPSLSGTLEYSNKDSFAYTGSRKAYESTYDWDAATSSWALTYEERIHLNTAQLPDSAWSHTIQTQDTVIVKLSYNSAGDPSYSRTYEGRNANPSLETRWYYKDSFRSTGVATGNSIKHDLKVSPNPATQVIEISGAAGRYIIMNAAGQTIESGMLSSGSSQLSIGNLSSGSYFLWVEDSAGITHAARFIRQ